MTVPITVGDAAVTIRAVEPSDVDAVLDVHIRARTAYYQGYLPDELIAEDNAELRQHRHRYAEDAACPANTMLCAVVDGVVAGFALARPPQTFAPADGLVELHQIHVDPAHWRRGIGTGLLGACLDGWRQAGMRTARLWVWDFNARARSFYVHHGWRFEAGESIDARIGPYRMSCYRLDLPVEAGPHRET
jgi:ribosomal protein S18 acetylase RimI-like enzyme